jgi:Immunity protein 26
MIAKHASPLVYREGDYFGIPLREGGYATGLVARSPAGGRVLLGYFFGPRLSRPADMDGTRRYRPSDAVLVARFGDLSLQSGEWPIIGHSDPWDRNEWPLPEFVRVDSVSSDRAWKVRYSEDDPASVVHEEPCNPSQADALPADGLLGAGAVEIKLTEALASEQ